MSLELLTKELATFQASLTGRVDKNDISIKALQDAISRFEAEMLRPDAGRGSRSGGGRGELLGDILAKNTDVQKILEVQKGRLALKVGQLFPTEHKVLLSGSLVESDRGPRIVGQPTRALRLRDIIGAGRPTTSNQVDYLKETGYSSGASTQAEGASKGESTIALAVASAAVQTIATWLSASKQVVDDVEGLQTFINNRLLYFVKTQEEYQLLAGDGLGAHLNGLIPQSTAYASGTYNQPGDNKIDKLRHAILQLEAGDFEADAICLNPRDWHDIQLLKNEAGGSANSGDYLASDPLGGELRIPTLWGKAIIKTNAMAYGYFLTGQFSTAAEIRDRQTAIVELSFEDRDNFIRNLVTIRAEERLALTVMLPEAFIFGAL